MQELKRCSRCHSNILIQFFELNKQGEYFKTCNNCRNLGKEEMKARRENLDKTVVICPKCNWKIMRYNFENHQKNYSCETANMTNIPDYMTWAESKTQRPKPKPTPEEKQQHKQEYSRNYLYTNTEKIDERQNKSVYCVCGGTYALKHKCRHEESNRHQKYINTLN